MLEVIIARAVSNCLSKTRCHDYENETFPSKRTVSTRLQRSSVFRFISTHVFPPVLLVKVDERKRQRDIQRTDLVRTATPLPRLERDHQVDVAQRSLRLERGHRLRAENLG